MDRPKTAIAGFNPHILPVASSRLATAVAASIAVAALLLCATVGLTFLTTCASVAMPLAQ